MASFEKKWESTEDRSHDQLIDFDLPASIDFRIFIRFCEAYSNEFWIFSFVTWPLSTNHKIDEPHTNGQLIISTFDYHLTVSVFVYSSILPSFRRYPYHLTHQMVQIRITLILMCKDHPSCASRDWNWWHPMCTAGHTKETQLWHLVQESSDTRLISLSIYIRSTTSNIVLPTFVEKRHLISSNPDEEVVPICLLLRHCFSINSRESLM